VKTIGEIIEEVADGGKPDYDDLRYTLIAINALRTFDQRALMKLAEAKRLGQKPIITRGPEYQATQSFRRVKLAYQKPPKEYVGPSHDPDTEECQRFRRIAKGLMKKVMSRQTATD